MKRLCAVLVMLVGWPAYATEIIDFPLEEAEQGDPEAQFFMGQFYEGVGAPGYPDFEHQVRFGNLTEAVKWYRLAAEQGHISAQCRLGRWYLKGGVLPQDYSEAVKWYRPAAEQGYIRAQTMLGSFYENGIGVPQDYAEAMKWYRLAADRGLLTSHKNIPAQISLGGMYFDGRGVPQDYVQAHMWWDLAAAQGYEQGIEFRDIVAAKMTPAQIEEAQRLAREWVEANGDDETHSHSGYCP